MKHRAWKLGIYAYPHLVVGHVDSTVVVTVEARFSSGMSGIRRSWVDEVGNRRIESVEERRGGCDLRSCVRAGGERISYIQNKRKQESGVVTGGKKTQ